MLPYTINEYIKDFIVGSKDYWKDQFKIVLEQINKLPATHFLIKWFLEDSIFDHLNIWSNCYSDNVNKSFIHYVYQNWDSNTIKLILTKNYLRHQYNSSYNTIFHLTQDISFFLWGQKETEETPYYLFRFDSISKRYHDKGSSYDPQLIGETRGPPPGK